MNNESQGEIKNKEIPEGLMMDIDILPVVAVMHFARAHLPLLAPKSWRLYSPLMAQISDSRRSPRDRLYPISRCHVYGSKTWRLPYSAMKSSTIRGYTYKWISKKIICRNGSQRCLICMCVEAYDATTMQAHVIKRKFKEILALTRRSKWSWLTFIVLKLKTWWSVSIYGPIPGLHIRL